MREGPSSPGRYRGSSSRSSSRSNTASTEVGDVFKGVSSPSAGGGGGENNPEEEWWWWFLLCSPFFSTNGVYLSLRGAATTAGEKIIVGDDGWTVTRSGSSEF